MKKISIIISLILILALGYEGYLLYGKYDKINNLNDEISSREKVDEEYVTLLDSITKEVVKKTGRNKEAVYRTVKELLNNLVIYKYVTSGHMTEFINKMIDVINTEAWHGYNH